jgi:hypothetical protein
LVVLSSRIDSPAHQRDTTLKEVEFWIIVRLSGSSRCLSATMGFDGDLLSGGDAARRVSTKITKLFSPEMVTVLLN